MTHQEELTQILKGKGIGPESSKSLKCGDIERVKYLLRQGDVSETTKATLLTALLTLPPTDVESEFIDELKSDPSLYLSDSLQGFISGSNNEFQSVINSIIRHNDLNYEEATNAIKHLFDETPDFLKGSFLEAERLKRETFTENSAFLKVMKDQVQVFETSLPRLVDIGDCYDGCNRFTNLNLFLAPVLASLGYPCVVHSVDEVAPKMGVTHHQVLKEAGKNPLKPLAQVVNALEDKNISWGHFDQSIYHKELYSLKQVRKEMVKRPFLATFEKMLQPIRAKKNYLVTQYTHKHYRLEIAKLVEEFCTFEKTLHVKGMEGTCMVNPKIPAPSILISSNGLEEVNISGEQLGYTKSLLRNEGVQPADVLELGLRILRGEDIPERSFFVFQGAMLLHYLFGIEFNKAEEKILYSLDNQLGLSCWVAY